MSVLIAFHALLFIHPLYCTATGLALSARTVAYPVVRAGASPLQRAGPEAAGREHAGRSAPSPQAMHTHSARVLLLSCLECKAGEIAP